MSSGGSKIKNFPVTEAAALASRASERVVVVVVAERRQLGGRSWGGSGLEGWREGWSPGERESMGDRELSANSNRERRGEREREREKALAGPRQRALVRLGGPATSCGPSPSRRSGPPPPTAIRPHKFPVWPTDGGDANTPGKLAQQTGSAHLTCQIFSGPMISYTEEFIS
ncbi:hypothetical protein E2C01_080779 [Portunus trituberculatus]|uniref:Uncharacterized protein n=1 Tax=Portunus trituberculatus TaxID=210409 RepID=A0A5B7IKI6_PORTR|nr:hypothetical protein [Portunus trituberculatus]